MMDKETGTFMPIPRETERAIAGYVGPERSKYAAGLLAKLPRPTLSIGELVEIKGVRFMVLRMKADGKLGLKMMAKEGART